MKGVAGGRSLDVPPRKDQGRAGFKEGEPSVRV